MRRFLSSVYILIIISIISLLLTVQKAYAQSGCVDIVVTNLSTVQRLPDVQDTLTVEVEARNLCGQDFTGGRIFAHFKLDTGETAWFTNPNAVQDIGDFPSGSIQSAILSTGIRGGPRCLVRESVVVQGTFQDSSGIEQGTGSQQTIILGGIGAFLSGSTVDESGNLIGNVTVQISGGENSGTTPSNGSGFYFFRRLNCNNTYTLVAYTSDGRLRSSPTTLNISLDNLCNGQGRRVDLVLIPVAGPPLPPPPPPAPAPTPTPAPACPVINCSYSQVVGGQTQCFSGHSDSASCDPNNIYTCFNNTVCSFVQNCSGSTSTQVSCPVSAPSLTTFKGPACATGGYSANLSWSGTALPPNDPGCPNGYWVDISTNSNFSTYSNKCVQDTQTSAPSGFGGPAGSFTFQKEVTYYARVYNGSHSNTLSLNVPACAASCSLIRSCSGLTCSFNSSYLVSGVPQSSYLINLHPDTNNFSIQSGWQANGPISWTYQPGTYTARMEAKANDGSLPTSCDNGPFTLSQWNPPSCSNTRVFSGCNVTGQPRCTDYGNSNYTSSGWTQAQWNTCNTACSKTNPNDYCILPSCTISANPPLGPSPLTTNLSVAVDTTLMPPSKVSYWDFGDGKTEFNQSLTNTHTYTSSIPPQTFNPSFKAVDSITNTDLSQSCSTPVGIIGSDTNPITAPTVSTPACINPGYSGSGVTISWTNPGVTWVDISRANDVSFTTPYYHESISGLTSTTAPNGFNATDGSGPLILNPNTTYTYYVRTFNGVRNSRLASFSIPSCSAPPSVIPPPSPSCTIYDPPDDTPLVSPQADGKVQVSYSFPGPANQRPGINLFRSSSLGFLPAGTLIGNQVGNFGRSFHTNPNQNQIYYYQLQNSNGSKPETSSNTAGIAVPKLDPEVGNSCTNTPGQRLAVIQSAQQISSSPFKLTFKLIYTVSAYLSGCGRECTPTLVPPYLQLTRSGGIPAYLSWDSAISRTSRCVADFVFRQQGCGKTEYTAVYELALPPGTNDSLIISSYSNGQCSYQRAGGSAELTVSTDPGSAKQLILPQISATYLISGEQAQLGQISWNQTTDGQQSQVFVNSDRWSGTAVIDPATSLNYNNGLWTLTAVDDLSNLPSATYYYGAQIIRNGWCKEVKSDQAAFAWTKPTSAWIQTTGGDIHSNTNINTPGGP